MGILSSMVTALRFFYPSLNDISDQEKVTITFARIISKLRTMAAMSYRISRGYGVVYPKHDLSYCANFLNMMFDTPVRPYMLDDDVIRALNIFWILHADHGKIVQLQQCALSGAPWQIYMPPSLPVFPHYGGRCMAEQIRLL